MDMDDEGGQANEKIAILDAGAQCAELSDRRIRELNVEPVILPLDTPAYNLKESDFRGIIVSGGPNSVYSEDGLGHFPDQRPGAGDLLRDADDEQGVQLSVQPAGQDELEPGLHHLSRGPGLQGPDAPLWRGGQHGLHSSPPQGPGSRQSHRGAH